MKFAYANTNVVSFDSRYHEDGDHVVLCLYGPRGGTQFTCELTLDNARNLIASLNSALRELGGKPETAIIEISGGVAELTQCPPHIAVEIIDHDNLEADAEEMKPDRVNYGVGQV